MNHIGRFIPENNSSVLPESEPDFNKFTISQLKDIAATDGIDLGSAKTKAEILKVISTSFKE